MISLCCAWGNNSFSLTQSFQRMKKHLGKKLWTRESCVPLSALSLTAAYKCLVAESSTCGGGGGRQKPSCPLPPQSPRLLTGEPAAPECCTSAWSEIVLEKQVLKSITVVLPGARQDAQPSVGSQAPLLTPTLRRALLLCMRASLGF